MRKLLVLLLLAGCGGVPEGDEPLLPGRYAFHIDEIETYGAPVSNGVVVLEVNHVPVAEGWIGDALEASLLSGDRIDFFLRSDEGAVHVKWIATESTIERMLYGEEGQMSWLRFTLEPR